MTLQFTKAERIALKSHPVFSEKWVQSIICQDPSILGLGELALLTSEKIQPKAGRLDLLLHDEQINRRYEVELMLGATDPSHIIRCIEYWDIERRRYPAYDHVAVLVAEDITSPFLNVVSLLSGNIPMIAIQLAAFQFDGKIMLQCVKVLDQTALRTDDAFELGAGSGGVESTDRAYWEKRTSPEAMKACDTVLNIVQELAQQLHSLGYRKTLVDVVPNGGGDASVWMIPGKSVIRVGAYVAEPEKWVKHFDDLGQTASLKRGNKAARITFSLGELATHTEELRKFLTSAICPDIVVAS